jgi:hypothetical protein
MTVGAIIRDVDDGTAVATGRSFDTAHMTQHDERALMTTNPVWRHSTFKSAEFAGPVTIALVSPNDDGSLILSDLVVTGDKVNNGSIEVQFTDDVDEAIIIKPVTTDAPVVVSINFNGQVRGWKDARINVIVTGVVIGSVLATYVKVPGGIPFAEWDALR